ncbi:hypothetical protein FOA52_003288 [Chlamydomonas sp. UWO 241]|nr:hypothetical protein FOA52_003288 [Chlamydomonas sp. UWO 241]
MEAGTAIPTPDSSGSTYTPAVARTATPLTAASAITVNASSAPAFTLAPAATITNAAFAVTTATVTVTLTTPPSFTLAPSTPHTSAFAPSVTITATTPPTITLADAPPPASAIAPTVTITAATPPSFTLTAAPPPASAIVPTITIAAATPPSITAAAAPPPTSAIAPSITITAATPPSITITAAPPSTSAIAASVTITPRTAATVPVSSTVTTGAAASHAASPPRISSNHAAASPCATSPGPSRNHIPVSGTVSILPGNRIPAGPSEAVQIARQQANQSLILLVVTFSQPVADFRVASIDVEHAVIVISKAVDGNTTFKLLATGDAGTRGSFWLDRSMYHDALGHPGASDLNLTVDVPSGGGTAAMDVGNPMSTTAATVLGAALAAGVVSAVSSLSLINSGLMHSASHIQGVSHAYREVALSFRWTILGMKGYLPFLDGLDTGSGSAITTQTNASGVDTNWDSVAPPSRMLLPVDDGTLETEVTAVRQEPQATQELVYTLIVAALVLAVFIVAHAAINLAFRLFADRPLPHVMWFPRFETGLTALLLVAITFFCCLLLGDPDALPGFSGSGFGVGDSTGFSVVVLMCLPVPFAAFLWWLLLGRVHRAQAREAADATSFKYSMCADHALRRRTSAELQPCA